MKRLLKLKEGVSLGELDDRGRALVYILASLWYEEFNEALEVTSGYRDDGTSHTGRAAIDTARPSHRYARQPYKYDIEQLQQKEIAFARKIQDNFGAWIGVQVEPEWGEGDGYTAPHIHWQMKPMPLYYRGD